MKKALMILALLATGMCASAQDTVTYHSIFGDSTTMWEGINVDAGGVDIILMTSKADDTAVIDGQKYLVQRDYQEIHWQPGYSVCGRYYIRESESKDKIYLRYGCYGDTTSEILVMDLSLKVGDTLNTGTWANCAALGTRPAPQIMIDSIFYLDGRKMMRTNCIAQYPYSSHPIYDTLYFIEGVGPSMGIGYPVHATDPLYTSEGISWACCPSIWCHFKDSVLDFHYTNYYSINMDWSEGYVVCSYSEIVSLQNNGKRQIEVYPNPSQDKITISGSLSPQSRYKIVTLDGKVMSEGSLPYDSNTIDISNFGRGVYLICIEDNKNKTIKKIVKL